MYELRDKESAVREVQKMLRYVSDAVEYDLPTVSIDGIYGEETRNSVLVFQEQNGLYADGRVDYDTYLLLYSAYNEAKGEHKRNQYIITNNGFPFAIGMQNADVAHLNLLLNELSKSYPSLPKNLRGNYFSDETEKAVYELQKMFLYEENGIVDAFLYERILSEVSHNNRLSEKYE